MGWGGLGALVVIGSKCILLESERALSKSYGGKSVFLVDQSIVFRDQGITDPICGGISTQLLISTALLHRLLEKIDNGNFKLTCVYIAGHMLTYVRS